MDWTGYFINPMGYDLKKYPTTEIYLFKLDPKMPLTYRLLDGGKVQPNKMFNTDMASIPLLFQWIPFFQKDKFLSPYFHDSAYRDGGIWVDGKLMPLTRAEADQMLREMLQAENAPVVKWLYWAGVRAGGWLSWKRKHSKVEVKS